MLHWVLKCPQCKIRFTHSEVHVDRKRYGLWMLPSKPEFHEGGSWIECPNCNTTSLFQRVQLDYAPPGEAGGRIEQHEVTIPTRLPGLAPERHYPNVPPGRPLGFGTTRTKYTNPPGYSKALFIVSTVPEIVRPAD